MTAPARAVDRPKAVAAWRPAFIRSAPLRIAVIAICALWSIPTIGLLVTSVRNPADITASGWWEALLNPLKEGQWTLGNYQAVLAGEGFVTAFINSLVVTIPSTVIPITIAAFAAYAFAWIKLSRPRHPVRRCRRTPRRTPPDVADPGAAAVRPDRAQRHVPGNLAGAHGVRASIGNLPALQLHLSVTARPLRVGRHRRRVALPGLHPPRPAAVGTGNRCVRHLPVPMGLERPIGGARVPGHGPGPAGPAVRIERADR